MFKTCYLHIGGEKTGSTTIQKFLADNRGRLRDLGVVYPKVPGEHTHIRLAAYAQPDFENADFLRGVGVKDEADLARVHARFPERFRAELTSVVRPMSVLLLSNEHCQTQVTTEAGVRRLQELLRTVAEKVRIIYYVRRQDHAAVSLYSTALRRGMAIPAPDLSAPETSHRFNHLRVCKLYAGVFGEQALDVRLFDETRFAGGSLISDFCAATAIDGKNWPRASAENTALGSDAQRLLVFLNSLHDAPFAPFDGENRDALIAALENEKCDGGIVPSCAAAMAFVERFSESNEAVRAQYFPHIEGPLFGDDFSRYPQVAGDAAMEKVEAIAYLRRILPTHSSAIDVLEASLT
ncbi:hypothetical protein [Kordiimonas sp.]|uniref:hypothetical protein n=1 Tax=Kordiimonas sp. TaxID=1970157 RepID=UPI003A905F50